MRTVGRTLLAFVRKDFSLLTSYHFATALALIELLSGLLIYFFIDRLFGQEVVGYLTPYGVGYFAYVLLGLALFSFMGTGITGLAAQVGSEQVMGTLEAILITPLRPGLLAVGLSLWGVLYAGGEMLGYLLLGALLFSAPVGNANLLSVAVILLLAVVSFNSLGLLAASVIVVFKRGNPVAWFFQGIAGLVGGVYFPVEVLPEWLQTLSALIPVTYAVRGLQLAVYQGASLPTLWGEILPLAFLAAVLLPLGLPSETGRKPRPLLSSMTVNAVHGSQFTGKFECRNPRSSVVGRRWSVVGRRSSHLTADGWEGVLVGATEVQGGEAL
jgi:ABC-2 type transport system permease protein